MKRSIRGEELSILGTKQANGRHSGVCKVGPKQKRN